MPKQLLTPAQIAEKYIKVNNPNCENEKRIKGLIRAEMAQYIEVYAANEVKKATQEQTVY